uniref:PP2A regulatory subunit B'' EF-hand domain-containing protein n=1 Tax=Panagrolaimus sp. PS1159 TaxID=55785 RepID=A0AC35FXG9_9BILA
MFLPSSLTPASTTFSPLKPPFSPSRRKIEGKLSAIPRFHFPFGKTISPIENDATLSEIEEIFDASQQQVLRPRDFNEVCRKMSLPVYTKRAVYEAVCQCSSLTAEDNPDVTFNQFVTFWNELIQKNHDEASRFIFTLAVAKTGLPGRQYLEKEDFHSILYDLISTYPGLNFLIDSPLFHARYVEAVIVRIFWNVNRSWSGRITAHELRKSNFLQTMHLLEEIDDINKITDYFSYEHFYVIYCKFWEIDFDHDMIISREDMKNHCDGALTNMIIDRIFSNAVNRYPLTKKQPIASSSTRRGPVQFSNVVNQLYDLVSPEDPKTITLRDLKRCGLAHRFFNTFVNYLKYLEQESADGEGATIKMNGDKELSDWEKFCAVEYEILFTEDEENHDT